MPWCGESEEVKRRDGRNESEAMKGTQGKRKGRKSNNGS